MQSSLSFMICLFCTLALPVFLESFSDPKYKGYCHHKNIVILTILDIGSPILFFEYNLYAKIGSVTHRTSHVFVHE